MALIAPVISGRKGEHQQAIEELRGKGFVRARVDGKYVELDAVPKLDPKKKHSIDAVVDRLKVRPDLQQRLAESFETALRLGEGSARVAFLDEPKREELVFSDKFACRICGYSVSELEPRLFSFNNPFGACPGCDGLGVKQFFDPDRVVTNAQLSLANGAVRGWDRRNAYYYQMIQALADHYRFDPEAPYASLPQKARDVLMQGSDGEEIEFRYFDARGRTVKRKHKFEGVLPNLERRYNETESLAVREELARYLGTRRCPECDGARLTKAARFVFVGGTALPTISALPVRRALEFFHALTLEGWRQKIAAKIVKEITDRLGFLVDVGLDYLTLDRSAETLSGGEAQRIRLASQIGSGLVGVMYILDEPSIGLHQRDNQRLLDTLHRLRDLGNTVIVVEHDEDAIRQADHVVDLGPGAGVHGGRIVAEGTPRRDRGDPRLAHRPVPLRPQAHRDPRQAPQERAEAAVEAAQGERQQPEGHRRVVPGRAAHLRHRRLGFRKVDAGERHALPRGRALAQPRRRAAGDLRGRRGTRGDRPRDRHRPEPDRAHAALEPGHLHRPVHAHPRAVRGHGRGALARLPGRAASASTSRAGAAPPARATASSRSRCTSCRTCTSPATSARAGATTARRSTCTSRARTSTKCST